MNCSFNNKYFLLLFAFFIILFDLNAQETTPDTQTNGVGPSNIITAVPFLLITPDARTGSMGNAGVAIIGDGNASSINPSKIAFLEKEMGFAISYSPWLKSLVPDVSLAYLSAYYQIDDRNSLATSFRYFNLGQIQLTDNNQQDMGISNPNELALDLSYARKFGDNFSLATTLRYIHSNLNSGQVSGGFANIGSSAIAVDVSALFKEETILFGQDAIWSMGANISNIGTKMSYANSSQAYFLPGNLKIGAASTFLLDELSQLTFALDFNKLLVPTQPIYSLAGTILKGKDPFRSVPEGIFGSFTDAPGGFREELREVGVSLGTEFWYNQQFALRAGYNYQDPTKGGSNYLTFGAGLKYNVFNIDFSYLIANARNNPLANTLRFSILFNIDRKKTINDNPI